MIKILFRIGLFFVLNLFAFLSVGHILGAILGKNPEFTIVFLLVSFVPLGVFLQLQITKTLKDFTSVESTDKESIHDRNTTN